MTSRNQRTMTAIASSEPGCLTVIGSQCGSEGMPGALIRWRFYKAPLENIVSVGIQLSRPAVAPMAKMAPALQMSHPEPPNPVALPSRQVDALPSMRVPGDLEIQKKDIFFDLDFFKKQWLKEHPTVSSVDDRLIEEDWDKKGIQSGDWGSPAFNVKFYLEHHEKLRDRIAPDDYKAAADYFWEHVDDPVQTSENFNYVVYQQYPECRHLTPKQLFVHFNRIGFKHKVLAV